MRKLIAGIVLLFFSTTSFALEQASLKRAIDTLNYRLTVEWDQKNKIARDLYVEEFKASINTLRANGMTEDEMMDSVFDLVKDPEMKKQFLLSQGEISKLKSTDEIMSFVISNKSKFSSQGASYVGGQIVGFSIAGLIIAGILTTIIVAIVKNDKRQWVCTKYAPTEVCKSSYCASYSSTDHYDSNGNYTGYSQTCDYYQEACHMENRCSEGYYQDKEG